MKNIANPIRTASQFDIKSRLVIYPLLARSSLQSTSIPYPRRRPPYSMPCAVLLFPEHTPVTCSCYSFLTRRRLSRSTANRPTSLAVPWQFRCTTTSLNFPCSTTNHPTSLGLALSRHLSYCTTFRPSLSGYLSIPLRNFGNAGTIYRATRRFRQQTLRLQRTIPVAIAPYWRI